MSRTEEMISLAKVALGNAYAPYSQFPVGACVRSESGRLYVGCNVENASYPVGTCAEAVAIGALVTAGDREIREVTIVTSASEPTPPCGACRQRLLELASPDMTIGMYTLDGRMRRMALAKLLPHPFVPWHEDEDS